MEAARAEREDESHAVLDKPSVESEVQPQAPAQASESSAPHDAPESKDDISGFVEHLPAYPLIVSIMGRVCQEECVTIDGAIFMGRPADVQKPLASMAYLQENLTVPVVDFRKDAIIDELKDTPEKDCMQRRSTYFADCSAVVAEDVNLTGKKNKAVVAEDVSLTGKKNKTQNPDNEDWTQVVVVSKEEVPSPPRTRVVVNETILINDDESENEGESQSPSSDASECEASNHSTATDSDLTPPKPCANGLRGRGGRGRGRAAKAKARTGQAKAKASPKTRARSVLKKPAAATAAKSRASKPVLDDAPDTGDSATVSEKARRAAQLAVEMLQNSKPQRRSQSRSHAAALPSEFEDS
eukprot:symbB.v1.2.032565.t1/scaffold3889.1/size48810/3